MNKLTNEQIQAIVNGAPEGATHYAADDGEDGAYVMMNESGFHNWYPDGWAWEYREEWFRVTNSLSDFRRILEKEKENEELRQEIAQLKAEQSEVAARAVESFADKYELCAPHNWYLHAKEYAVRLRKGDGDE